MDASDITWRKTSAGRGVLRDAVFANGDWCGAPSRVWVELAPLPLWLEPGTLDKFAGCWVAEALSKVGCSEVSVMVWRT
jgi:hypothetical protein